MHEEEVAQKPSILLHLTLEEILRYWSALSDAQRQAVLERADVRRVGGIGGLPALATQSGMFDRFAGVFHAFERLREAIEKAIAEKRPLDAEYRLFGAKHDSLPSLLDRLTDEPGSPGDASPTDDTSRLAVRYATLLSARRLLQQLEASSSSFLADHPVELKALRAKMAVPGLREAVIAGCGDEGEAFVVWFDRWFLDRHDRGGQG